MNERRQANGGNVLEVEGLRKEYPGFRLEDVSFTVRQGAITGFIGRNGAGKSTTLKCLFNIVHPDGGSVRFFGLDFQTHELEVKRRAALTFGEADYFIKRPLRSIVSVYSRFFPSWDERLFEDYLRRFALDPGKKVQELSSGMRVKFALALTMARSPELLLLDEPTSGLDPVSRDELLSLFMDLLDEGRCGGILFSTHLMSDLERCADDLVYISGGRIVASARIADFLRSYLLVRGPEQHLDARLESSLIGARRRRGEFEGLLATASRDLVPTGVDVTEPTLEDIVVHTERQV